MRLANKSVREVMDVQFNCEITNLDEFQHIKTKLREEADGLYKEMDKGEYERAFTHYYQLSHLINQLSEYRPLQDLFIDK